MHSTKQLLNLIELEQTAEHVFKGRSKPIGSPNVFGGQVISQALNAATRTVSKDRFCHSLHAYFILPGKLDSSIYFHVQKIRDGGSFTTRYIVAKQDDIPIFVMAASYQIKEEGYTHQIEMPKVPEPETLLNWTEIFGQLKNILPERTANFLSVSRPIEIKPCQLDDPLDGAIDSKFQVWFRFKEIPENITWPMIQQLLSYASDYNILATALRPHGKTANFGNTHMASLDHAIWFHNETDLDDWMLFSLDTPSASGARGFASGHIFNRKGLLVASVSQEGLMRPRN